MATDKKISELTQASEIQLSDLSVLVDNDSNYNYPFSLLITLIQENIAVGSLISFGTVIPQNTDGNDTDVFIKTDTAVFYQKVAGAWGVAFTLPGQVGDGTVIYGSGVPANTTGKNGDTYINTLTGIFYFKSSGAFAQVFSMATGPQGPQGVAGTNGTNGTNGNTILNGTTNPSNSLGANGDFYINTNTLAIFGPKTGGVWGEGQSLTPGGVEPYTLKIAAGTTIPLNLVMNTGLISYGDKPTLITDCFIAANKLAEFKDIQINKNFTSIGAAGGVGLVSIDVYGHPDATSGTTFAEDTYLTIK